MIKGGAVASIAITYIASAMTTATALERHLRDLKAAAKTISTLAGSRLNTSN